MISHAKYWVVGGRYANTGFREFAPGAREERYGPFASYREAKAEWAQRSWQSVDDCHRRFRILQDAELPEVAQAAAARSAVFAGAATRRARK